MELRDVIKCRRSVRSFDPDKQIGKSDIELILQAGEQAPVGKGKYVDIAFTVVQDKNVLDKIIKAAAEQGKSYTDNVFYNAPTIIVISQNKLEEFLPLAYQNAGCIGENMLLQATELGIGSVYIYSAVRSIVGVDDILQDLKLPEGFTPAAIMALGYNKDDNKKKFPRSVKTNWV